MVETVFRVVVMLSGAALFVVLGVLVLLKGARDAAFATVRSLAAPAWRRVPGAAARRRS